MRKGLSILLALILVIGGSTFAFASTLGEQPPIPVWLTAPAIGDSGGGGSGEGGIVGGVDFSITDKVPMTVTPGSSTLNFPDIKVTNNANTGHLLIYKVEVETVNGWTLKPDKASYFEKLKADTKELSIVADGVHDFATNSIYLLGESKLVAPKGESNTVSFSGHVGTFTQEMKCIVANIIPTIAIY